MTTNKTGNAGQFQKGDDPRRNKTGPRSKEAASFAKLFANALASGGKPKELTDVLWAKARKGQPWAIEIILDRLIGKPKENEGRPQVYRVFYAETNGGGK